MNLLRFFKRLSEIRYVKVLGKLQRAVWMLTEKPITSKFSPVAEMVYLIAGDHTPTESAQQQEGPLQNVKQIVFSLI